jgi:hypothetical protein
MSGSYQSKAEERQGGAGLGSRGTLRQATVLHDQLDRVKTRAPTERKHRPYRGLAPLRAGAARAAGGRAALPASGAVAVTLVACAVLLRRAVAGG